MPHLSRLLPAAVLALCATAAAAAAVPGFRDVRLSEEALTIVLTDGTYCRLKNWQARPAGRFDACSPGLAYAIVRDPAPNLLRRAAEGLTGALGAGAVLQPMAVVTLTDAGGRRHEFTSPAPITDFDW